jgi:ABC-type spermidine/putrescine transport system permease subunit II
MASLIAWLLFFLAITPDDLTPQVFRAAVWNSVRIAAVMALVTGIFGWLLYASRVGREATDPANRRNDA